MARVHLDRVTVDFPIFSSKMRSLRFALASRLGGALERDRGTVIVRALDGVNLDLAGGDRLAVVGHNGSGKTTLLRTIAGVYPPLTGTMAIEGKISAFTDLMLGMDLEASGSENIIFRLVFLGLTFAEARKLAPEIGEFTELGDYLDMPVRTYSMGMMLRLAFAIATAIHPDILLMDEMVSTGDPAFIDKAMARIKSLLDRTSILVLASQMPPLLEMFCNRAVWLDHGRIRALGSTREVLGLYLDSQSQDRGKEAPPQAKSASSPAASGGAQAADRAGG